MTRAKEGFTLTETILAVLILSVAIIPVLLIFTPQVKVTTTDKVRSVLLSLAQKKMDETVNALQVDYEVALVSGGDFTSEGYATYRYTLTASDVVANLLKNVQVLVWDDENGSTTRESKEVNLTLDTQVAKREL